MARYAVYLCNPGATGARDRYSPEQLVELCKCRHPRHEHWWGGGACGECGGRIDGRGCDYFRPRKEPSTVPDDQHITTGAGSDVA